MKSFGICLMWLAALAFLGALVAAFVGLSHGWNNPEIGQPLAMLILVFWVGPLAVLSFVLLYVGYVMTVPGPPPRPGAPAPTRAGPLGQWLMLIGAGWLVYVAVMNTIALTGQMAMPRSFAEVGSYGMLVITAMPRVFSGTFWPVLVMVSGVIVGQVWKIPARPAEGGPLN